MTVADPLPHPTWGPLVGGYFVLIGLPSGVGLTSWWLAATGRLDPRLGRLANQLSLASLLAVAVILTVDLGRPERFFLMLTRFGRLGSPISVGAKLIAAKTALVALTVYAERPAPLIPVRTGRPAPARLTATAARTLPWLIGVLSFALAVYPAAVLSRTWSSPLASSPAAALLFALTALLMGAATLVALNAVRRSAPEPDATTTCLRSLAMALLGAYAIAMFFDGLALSGNPQYYAVSRALVSGTYAPAFWGGVIVVGIVLPAGAFAANRGRRLDLTAALTMLVGACVARYLLFAVHT